MTDPTRADLPVPPEAWMNPETLEVVHATRKDQWIASDGGYKIIAEKYTQPLFAAGLAAQPAQGGDLERTAPAGYVLVKAEKLVHARRQAKLAADCIVGFAKDRPNGMCGWLDDACTAADIAASDLDALLAASPPAPVAEQGYGSQLQQALDFISEIGAELLHRRSTDWYPEGANNAALSMSEDMRLIGNACADFAPTASATQDTP